MKDPCYLPKRSQVGAIVILDHGVKKTAKPFKFVVQLDETTLRVFAISVRGFCRNRRGLEAEPGDEGLGNQSVVTI